MKLNNYKVILLLKKCNGNVDSIKLIKTEFIF